MAIGQMQLSMACENPKCRHAILLEVTHTVAKNVPAISLQAGLESAGVALGYARVHSPGATPQVFCGMCRGRVVCRACGIERVGRDLCSSPSFDVDRVIEEGQGDADRR